MMRQFQDFVTESLQAAVISFSFKVTDVSNIMLFLRNGKSNKIVLFLQLERIVRDQYFVVKVSRNEVISGVLNIFGGCEIL